MVRFRWQGENRRQQGSRSQGDYGGKEQPRRTNVFCPFLQIYELLSQVRQQESSAFFLAGRGFADILLLPEQLRILKNDANDKRLMSSKMLLS